MIRGGGRVGKRGGLKMGEGLRLGIRIRVKDGKGGRVRGGENGKGLRLGKGRKFNAGEMEKG